MNGLGKGIAIGLCAVAIGFAVWVTKDARCLIAFIPVAWITGNWRTK